MKTIGLLGGITWESTMEYYRGINQTINKRLGGYHSANIAMFSMDFAPVEKLQHAGDWDGVARIMIDSARKVEAAGADFLVICTNTLHKVAPEVERAIRIPLLHIADAVGENALCRGFEAVGLLGTAFTMEESFYRDRLSEKHGLNVLVPEPADRRLIHDVIFNELCHGTVDDGSRSEYLRIIDDLASRGADAIILGCTEFGMLVDQTHTRVPLLDTVEIHVRAAAGAAV